MTNNADKRDVSTDALETMGMVHTKQEYRDAIHLGVEPVEAGESLKAGDHVGLVNGVAYKKKNVDKLVGIVDPFISGKINKGDKFWLVVYPRKITSLRHVWSHPDFEESDSITVPTPQTDSAKYAAYEWIQNYAESFGSGDDVDADDLINFGRSYYYDRIRGVWPDYLVVGGLFEGEYVSDEFWQQLAIYLDEKLEPQFTGNFFSCSC